MTWMLAVALGLLAGVVTHRLLRGPPGRLTGWERTWACTSGSGVRSVDHTWVDTSLMVPSDHDRSPCSSCAAPVPRRIDRYEVERELARGGSAVVYQAFDPLLDRPVALKILLETSPRSVARFQAEARAVAELQHPHVVSIYAVGEARERWFQALELVEGGSLEARLQREGALSCRAAARLAEQLARALHSVHEQGILHRDVKPGNVLLTPSGQPRLVDFGLAKRLHAEELAETLPGTILGTPSFMSPEQARGAAVDVVDARTDVYGVGATLYATLTRTAPFKGRTWYEVLGAVLQRAPTAPSLLNAAVDADLEAICLKCLEKEPWRRYADALALADALGRYLQGGVRSRSTAAPACA